MKYFISIVSLLAYLSISSQAISPNIHIDQFGYTEAADKVAVFSNPELGFNSNINYTPGSTIELRNAENNVPVFSGTIQSWNSGNIHDQSGDRGWWFDFSSVQTSGSYYIYDVNNDLRSYEFEINNHIYEPILEAAGRMFYYNRCGTNKLSTHAGINWADGFNFLQDENTKYIEDPNNASLFKDLSGGWFDAGDYNKYVNYTLGAVNNLLWAYQENPDAFSDQWNIPESGNGVPDILDEIKWELDWVLKMINDDGTVHIKVGSNSFDENEAAPPSVNNDPRYYGPTCSSSEISACNMLAHAASVYNNTVGMESYGQLLEDKAILVWQQVLPQLNNNTLDTNCDDLSINSSDSDKEPDVQRSDALSAAIYLYALTGTASYHQYVISNASDSKPLGEDLWDNYNLNDIDALLLYTTLPNNNAALSQQILNGFNTAINNNWNQYFGWNNDDLYRADMPDWTYHWGSNSPKASFSVLNQLIVRYDVNSSLDFEKRSEETIHYFHGINPLNFCYISNMDAYGAENSAHEIYHTWFADGSPWDNSLTELGPAPGFIVGGPNQNYNANTNLLPPYNQPAQKSYLEFNDIANSSWEITEPAIYYNAIYLRMLSAYTQRSKLDLMLKTNLEGPYDTNDLLMHDLLRENALIPLTEPFTTLGFDLIQGGGETISASLFNVLGNDALVDWILVELRDPNSPTTILSTQPALLQRDGDIVSLDGVSPISFYGIETDEVYVVLRHRNHFGMRTANTYPTSAAITVDFSNPNVPLFGDSPNIDDQHPMVTVNGVRLMISGDANMDGQVNTTDKNDHWRPGNSQPYSYLDSKADFDLNGTVNAIDKNENWRTNNSKVEILD